MNGIERNNNKGALTLERQKKKKTGPTSMLCKGGGKEKGPTQTIIRSLLHADGRPLNWKGRKLEERSPYMI